jgi:hypothetical protein
MKLIKETYVSWGAEVVFITSNLGGNREMMEGCKREGIPAFGTLVRFPPPTSEGKLKKVDYSGISKTFTSF